MARADPKDKPTFIAVVLHVYGGKGHVLSYQKAVGEAVRRNGWNHVIAASPDPKLSTLPADWRIQITDSGVLDYEGVKIKRLFKTANVWAFVRSMYDFTKSLSQLLKREMLKGCNDKIVFLETFNPLQLLCLYFALLPLKRGKLYVWLLHRGGPDWGGPEHRLMARSFAMTFKAIGKLIGAAIGRQNLVFLTDSDLLKRALEDYYKRPVYVVPIPHTPEVECNVPRTDSISDDIVCWWPGAPRPDKGLEVIKRITATVAPNAKKIRLVVARSTGLAAIPDGVKIEFVDDLLSRSEYDKRFRGSDLILLPYDRYLYSESTSGIFTECIVAGATPVVTRNTWMAYELNKHHLEELVLDWEKDDVVSRLVGVARDANIKMKMEMMRREYIGFHNIASYSQVIGAVYQHTASR